ncbi:hypothetical protein D6U78_10620 [Vibrio cholerae]|nr:hypothetical protein [Vibrio cholerae]
MDSEFDIYNELALKIFKEKVLDLKKIHNIESFIGLHGTSKWLLYVSGNVFEKNFDVIKATLAEISEQYSIEINVKFANQDFIKDNFEIQFKFAIPSDSIELSFESQAINTLQVLVEKAYNLNSSDVHLTLTDKLNAHFRVDKLMHRKLAEHYPLDIGQRIFNATMNTTNHGDIDFDNTQSKSIKFKVRNFKTDQMTPILVRIEKTPIDSRFESSQAMFLRLTQSVAPPTFDDIRVDHYIRKLMTKHIKESAGLILVTGPTGSGKTSLLGASLWEFPQNKTLRTLEDPAEFDLQCISPYMTQRSVDKSKWDSNLSSILRQDPDGILLGEIRNLEQAETCIEATNTGHLVLSTLHTKSAIGTIDRLLDMGVPIEQLTAEKTLSLIIATRLAPKTCQKCALRYSEIHPNLQDQLVHLKLSNEELENLRFANCIGSDLQRVPGIWNNHSNDLSCSCNSGISGVEPVAEFLQFTDSIRNFLINKRSTLGLADELKKRGWLSIDDIALQKFKSGVLDPFMIKDHICDLTTPASLDDEFFGHLYIED